MKKDTRSILRFLFVFLMEKMEEIDGISEKNMRDAIIQLRTSKSPLKD